MGELIEEGVDLLAQVRPVVCEALGLEHVAPHPAPQLFDWIEPGRVGRQPDRRKARQWAQRGGDVVVGMDRPVVLDDGDAPRRRVDLSTASVEGADLRAADQLLTSVLRGKQIDSAPATEALTVADLGSPGSQGGCSAAMLMPAPPLCSRRLPRATTCKLSRRSVAARRASSPVVMGVTDHPHHH